MGSSDTSKDRGAGWSFLVEEIRYLGRTILSGRDLDGTPLTFRGRMRRVSTRVRNFRLFGGVKSTRWAWAILGLFFFVVLTIVLVLDFTWAPWLQFLLVGGLLVSGGWAAMSWHRIWARRSRHSAFYILGALSLYVVGLGGWFMRDCLPGRIPFVAQVYHALLLFTGQAAPESCHPVPLGLQVAELGGLIVLFATVLAVINEISSGPIARWRASLASRVILVTGLSDDTLPVIRALTEDPDRSLIVVVEPNPDHPLSHQVRRYGARVIKGEISTRTAEQRWLKGMCTAWGRHVSLRRAYLLSSDEQANLEAAKVIRDVLAGLGSAYHDPHQPPTRLIVRIDRYLPAHHHAAQQATHWRVGGETTGRHRSDLRTGPHVFISTLGRTQVIAHALAEHIATEDTPTHVMVVGDSDLSRAFADEWRLQRDTAAFLLDRTTPEQERRGDLQRRAALPDLERVAGLPSTAKLRERCEAGNRVSVLLAHEPDEAGRSKLETLATELRGLRVDVFIPTRGVRGLARIPLMGCLRPFGPSLGGDPVGPTEPGESTQPTPLQGVPQDSWFRAAKLAADSYAINGKPSTWYDAVPTERESNFRAAWSLLTWLAELGYTWSATRPEEPKPPSDDLLGLLIPLEHRAWMAFKHDTGWRGVHAATNDKKRRLNRLLHPLDELDEERRETAAQGTLHNLKSLMEIFEILGFHPVPPAAAHDRAWRFRRVGTVRVIQELDTTHTWKDDVGNTLTAHPGDLLIEGVQPPTATRSITAESFHATHEGTPVVGEYRRVGTVTARLAFPGEKVHSQEGDQTAAEDCWVLQDADGHQWLTTSAGLRQGYVIEGPCTS